MNENRASLEVIAATVEEAIEKGLKELGLAASDVDIEVLDAGSRGLFGLGSRHARVKLMIKAGEHETTAFEPAQTHQVSLPLVTQAPVEAEADKSEAFEGEPDWAGEEVETPAEVEAVLGQYVDERDAPAGAEMYERVPESGISAGGAVAEPEDDLALSVARDTIKDLLGMMKVRATVTARHGEAEDARSKVPLLVDVRGSDLSILIGPKAETLNALQYIASLIINKELGKSVPLVVDVEGFRARRTQQIRQLARRMAEQAVKTGRRQVLEPMPANERRLIHIELRNNPDVTTESIGEDPRRKVTIIPKNEG